MANLIQPTQFMAAMNYYGFSVPVQPKTISPFSGIGRGGFEQGSQRVSVNAGAASLVRQSRSFDRPHGFQMAAHDSGSSDSPDDMVSLTRKYVGRQIRAIVQKASGKRVVTGRVTNVTRSGGKVFLSTSRNSLIPLDDVIFLDDVVLEPADDLLAKKDIELEEAREKYANEKVVLESGGEQFFGTIITIYRSDDDREIYFRCKEQHQPFPLSSLVRLQTRREKFRGFAPRSRDDRYLESVGSAASRPSGSSKEPDVNVLTGTSLPASIHDIKLPKKFQFAVIGSIASQKTKQNIEYDPDKNMVKISGVSNGILTSQFGPGVIAYLIDGVLHSPQNIVTVSMEADIGSHPDISTKVNPEQYVLLVQTVPKSKMQIVGIIHAEQSLKTFSKSPFRLYTNRIVLDGVTYAVNDQGFLIAGPASYKR
jgi:hypothetical protein